MDGQLTLKKGAAYNENKLFFKMLSRSDNDAGHLLSTALSVLWGPGPCPCGHHLAIQISLLIEPLPRKADPDTCCFLMCHCVLLTAALLNQSCLLVLLQGTRDPLFLTGVTFPSEYPIYEETKLKLTVYDVKDKSYDTVSTCTYFFLWEKQ